MEHGAQSTQEGLHPAEYSVGADKPTLSLSMKVYLLPASVMVAERMHSPEEPTGATACHSMGKMHGFRGGRGRPV